MPLMRPMRRASFNSASRRSRASKDRRLPGAFMASSAATYAFAVMPADALVWGEGAAMMRAKVHDISELTSALGGAHTAYWAGLLRL